MGSFLSPSVSSAAVVAEEEELEEVES